MSQEYKFTKRVRSEQYEDKEIEITLPFFGKYLHDYGIVYVKIDEQLNEVVINVNEDCVTDCGNHQTFSIEIGTKKPHRFGYDYKFYTEKTSDEVEWSKAIVQILKAVEDAK